MNDNFIEQAVTIITEGERIDGFLYHLNAIRLSDFLNSSNHQGDPFVKVKDPTVYCRRTGEELSRSEFLMVARDRIVLLMTRPAEPLETPLRRQSIAY